MEFLEEQDPLSIHNEMQEIRSKIGQLEHRLMKLQWELNKHYQKYQMNYTYVSDKTDSGRKLY